MRCVGSAWWVTFSSQRSTSSSSTIWRFHSQSSTRDVPTTGRVRRSCRTRLRLSAAHKPELTRVSDRWTHLMASEHLDKAAGEGTPRRRAAQSVPLSGRSVCEHVLLFTARKTWHTQTYADAHTCRTQSRKHTIETGKWRVWWVGCYSNWRSH